MHQNPPALDQDAPATRGPVTPARSERSAPVAVERVVVIGNGMAGHRFCERLVASKRAARFSLTVFGEEPHAAYDRVRLTELFNGKSVNDLLLAPPGWHDRHQVQLLVGERVSGIDRKHHLVITDRDRRMPYDKIVFATGSSAFVPPVPGIRSEGVHVYRTIEDLEKIRGQCRAGDRALILGGGLLGLEAAKAVMDAGMQTVVIEHGSGLMARQLTPESSALLHRKICGLGIEVLTAHQLKRVDRQASHLRLVFNNGASIAGDLLIVAAGIRPRDELAVEAGITVGTRGGIVVDDRLRTSDPDIFAIGECALHNEKTYGLAAPGYQMAEVLVAVLNGERRRFLGADYSTRLKLLGIDVATLGRFQSDNHTFTHHRDGQFRRLVVEKKRLVGATSVGEWPEMNRVQEAIESRRFIWPWQLQRFEHTGHLWPAGTVAHVTQWPASAIVCNCTKLRRGSLSETIARERCATSEQLARLTGASTVCGSCKPLLAELVGETPAPAPQRGLKPLLFFSALALLAALLVLGLRPLPHLETETAGWKYDRLWTDGFWKRATGFSLLGVSLISLLLSLRKRIARFSRGSFTTWRIVHAALGTIALIGLVTHTGFRLGHNLNLVLMLNFLALALAGSLAGLVTALERKLPGPTGRSLRSLWTGLHIVLFWPLPVLLVFHVLKAYYY